LCRWCHFREIAVGRIRRLRPEIALSDVGIEPFGVDFVEVGVPESGTDEGAFVAGCELA
jgi:hypothetical protein